MDLSTIISLAELELLDPRKRVDIVQEKIFAYLGDNKKKIIILNPFFDASGMCVLGSFALDPAAIMVNDPSQRETMCAFAEMFSHVSGVQVINTSC